MNSDHDGLRRSLREALPTGADLPSPELLQRIVNGLPGARPQRRRLPIQLVNRAWLTLPAAAVLLLIVGAAILYPRAAQSAGRVEALADLGSVEFLSSQAQPADEYNDMTHQVLPGFNGRVDFNSQPTAAQDIDRIGYEEQVGQPTMDLVAMTHSDLATLQDENDLEDLTPLLQRLQKDRQFSQTALDDAGFGTGKHFYIPWLQATYMMVINRQALGYLPAGADPYHLTYDQLIAWGQKLQAATGKKKIGLPADLNTPRGGLIFRFLQGYAYPSFTGTTLTGFRSPEAVQMWKTLRDLWSVTNEESTTYTSMQAPLTTGEVWIAWDHQVRLKNALADDNDYIAVPAPTGPRGLGFMSVTVGLAIPKGAHNLAGAEALIDWLTKPSRQAAASAGLGFFPAVQHVKLSGPPAAEAKVAATYHATSPALETLPPEGLGTRGDDFNAVYQETFRRIVLDNQDIQTVLDDEAGKLQLIVNKAGAPCWPPDARSEGQCQIK